MQNNLKIWAILPASEEEESQMNLNGIKEAGGSVTKKGAVTAVTLSRRKSKIKIRQWSENYYYYLQKVSCKPRN